MESSVLLSLSANLMLTLVFTKIVKCVSVKIECVIRDVFSVYFDTEEHGKPFLAFKFYG